MELKIKKTNPKAKIPHYATKGAAGLDLTCVEREVTYKPEIKRFLGIPVKKIMKPVSVKYKTGLAFEIPKGYVGLLYPRSSVCKTGQIMANCVGVIDSDFRGEVSAVFYLSPNFVPYNVGDRCCQLVIQPIPQIEIKEVESLSETERGEGGFGSTGK